jgi:primosomal protein N' (replication factor Y)
MNPPDSPLVLKVALPVPLPRLFDYLPPESGLKTPPGSRVLVPFGRRKLVGVVAQEAAISELPKARLLRVIRALDDSRPLLDRGLLQLLRWCSHYYKHAPGEVMLGALPPALRAVEGSLPPPPLRYALTDEGKLRLSRPVGKAPVQHAMLEAMADGPVFADELCGIGVQWTRTVARLMEQGMVTAEPAGNDEMSPSKGPPLRKEQGAAVDAIGKELAHFRCHLLDGVTGSGKTEVYIHLLERVLASGRQALVMVPEIGLTPQLLRRFRQRLGVEPAVIHSSLGQARRLDAWAASRSGRARLLVGTRSALFTPLPRAGLFILDEEHDASFKQQDGFRYSARDVAVKRAAELDIPIVLGSATPSLESLQNAESGRYGWHRLRSRATRAAMPRWRVLDLRQQHTFHGLSGGALKAMEEAIERREQVMVYLNRRGYAPVLMCQQCGWHGSCDRCDAHLTWHRRAATLCCHHCGKQRPVPGLCPDCRADSLMGAGEGTQQLEEALEQRFPTTPVLRFDRDRTSRRGVMDRQLEQVLEGGACLLVGTQMLAKGHHFPNVTLVVIVNVDQALYSADYRALERLGQTVQQVAGRAGRTEKPGTVVLQTLQPEHPALQLLITQGYERYARWLLEERSMAGLPPFGYQALLRADAHKRETVEHFLRQACELFPRGPAEVYGPMPAIMERKGGRSRMYLLVQSQERATLHKQLDAWLGQLRGLPSARKVRWAVDVDPQEL